MVHRDNVNEERVKKLQRLAMDHPGAYKLRVLTLTLLGYGYIFLTIILFAVIAAALVYLVVRTNAPRAMIKLIIPLIGLIFFAVKSLWVTIPEPYGIILDRAEGVKFYEALEELRKEMKCSRIHRVLINHNFNASVVQRPMLGLLGWNRNYLIVGLPLMLALNPEDFKAIIAHELGHISRSHGSFGNWIYRVRESWFRIMEGLEEKEGRWSLLYSWFFKWYLPIFNEHSLVLVRQEEHDADKLAASVSGAEKTAEALVKGDVKYELLEEVFWPAVFDRANYQPNPPSEVFYDMEKFLKNDNHIKEEEYLKTALMGETTALSTHPSLRDRLAFLGQDARLNQEKSENAARELLGESINAIGSILNNIWKESALESWKERHSFIVEGSRRIIELRNKSREEQLGMEEKWEICYLTEELKGEEEALAVYREFLREYQDFMPANFALGRLLLAKGEEEGVELVERAMAGDYEYVIEGCRLIHNYFMGIEKPEEAKKYYERALKHSEILDLAEGERKLLEFKEIYSPSGLSEEETVSIIEQLAAYPEIAEAYLVRKNVKYLKEKPLYALGIVVDIPWYSPRNKYANVVDRVAEEVDFKEETLIAYLNDENTRLRKIMQKIPGAMIYKRED